MRIKLADSPLPLVGGLARGVVDSSALEDLTLDVEAPRGKDGGSWEKVGVENAERESQLPGSPEVPGGVQLSRSP